MANTNTSLSALLPQIFDSKTSTNKRKKWISAYRLIPQQLPGGSDVSLITLDKHHIAEKNQSKHNCHVLFCSSYMAQIIIENRNMSLTKNLKPEKLRKNWRLSVCVFDLNFASFISLWCWHLWTRECAHIPHKISLSTVSACKVSFSLSVKGATAGFVN